MQTTDYALHDAMPVILSRFMQKVNVIKDFQIKYSQLAELESKVKCFGVEIVQSLRYKRQFRVYLTTLTIVC